ncbi:hypothetical protein AAFF_G00333190 [Aldrovandia affinis]|uniref:Uncharacterized protein n=1 Tax=Aldrovandia affinis TaxID=143900 RepID=A0AAD7SMU4_9TELE|nr:hypothetical protein AAFF_G00333190 [Aldrovandia affinis]
MSQCRRRCRRQLAKVARYIYRFVMGTLAQVPPTPLQSGFDLRDLPVTSNTGAAFRDPSAPLCSLKVTPLSEKCSGST